MYVSVLSNGDDVVSNSKVFGWNEWCAFEFFEFFSPFHRFFSTFARFL